MLMALLDVVLQVGSRDRMTVSRSCRVMAVNTMNRPGAGASLLWVIMHHFPFYQGYHLTFRSAAKCHVCQDNGIGLALDYNGSILHPLSTFPAARWYNSKYSAQFWRNCVALLLTFVARQTHAVHQKSVEAVKRRKARVKSKRKTLQY